MSSNIKNPLDIQLLTAYGTLRDDDNSGAVWTKDFIKDISGATTGRVVGHRLLGHPTIGYPFAIFTGDPNDSIIVRLLSWPTKERFQEKIDYADIVEGDDYERRIVEVLVDGPTRHAYIYISKVNSLDEKWQVIPSGDWLQRHVK